jgi:holliday junction DNA helicase RuvB
MSTVFEPEEARIQDPGTLPEDDFDDGSLRPRRLEDFIGQEPVKDQLAVSIAAAASRGEALDHVLLAGPPGLGKTSLAQIVAAELHVPFVQTAGPALERKADIAAVLTALEPRAVFFVDEIHRLPRALEETFYPAMEDRSLPITVGQGAGARVITLDLPPFTLIGATTRAGLLTTPLRDRFGIQHRLEHYGSDDLAKIVHRSARLLAVAIDEGGARAIAERSRGTPRVANRLLKRVRDYVEVRGSGVVTSSEGAQALDLLQVDHEGLDRLDREILRAICEKFGGGPVGLSTLAVAVGEEADTIEDVYEPYLLQRGLLERTPRGRAATRRAFEHLGLDPPGPLALL